MKDFTEQLKTIEGMLSDAYDQGYADGLNATTAGGESAGSGESGSSEPAQPVSPVASPSGRLLHRVGLIADPHFNIEDSKGTEYAGDLVNALAYFGSLDIDLIISVGDYGEWTGDRTTLQAFVPILIFQKL